MPRKKQQAYNCKSLQRFVAFARRGRCLLGTAALSSVRDNFKGAWTTAGGEQRNTSFRRTLAELEACACRHVGIDVNLVLPYGIIESSTDPTGCRTVVVHHNPTLRYDSLTIHQTIDRTTPSAYMEYTFQRAQGYRSAGCCHSLSICLGGGTIKLRRCGTSPFQYPCDYSEWTCRTLASSCQPQTQPRDKAAWSRPTNTRDHAGVTRVSHIATKRSI
jgi:hypothetical protein